MGTKKFDEIDAITALFKCRCVVRDPSMLEMIINDIQEESPEGYTREEINKIGTLYFMALHEYSLQAMFTETEES